MRAKRDTEFGVGHQCCSVCVCHPILGSLSPGLRVRAPVTPIQRTHTRTHRHTHHWTLVVCASDCRLRLHRRIPDGIRRFSTLRTLIRNGHTNARRPDPVASAYIPLPILGWCRRSFLCVVVLLVIYIYSLATR